MSNANAGTMTVLEILNRTVAFFEKKGVPDFLLDAQYIISYGLGMKNRMDLYLNFEKPLTTAELDNLRPLVARRANREPLQHIIGDTSFRGHIIKCDPRALIPRPETEQLVDMVKSCVADKETPFIVDIGTGSGAIAISCAKEIKNAKILATDISDEALSLAKENATANGLNITDDLQFLQGNLLQAIPNNCEKIDCLVANLPYIPDGEKDNLQPEVAKYDPALALFGGADGLDLIRLLLQQTENRLNSGASILLEIASEQALVLQEEAKQYKWLEFSGIHKDYCDKFRFVSYRIL